MGAHSGWLLSIWVWIRRWLYNVLPLFYYYMLFIYIFIIPIQTYKYTHLHFESAGIRKDFLLNTFNSNDRRKYLYFLMILHLPVLQAFYRHLNIILIHFYWLLLLKSLLRFPVLVSRVLRKPVIWLLLRLGWLFFVCLSVCLIYLMSVW